jgi:DNA-binding MarR family transcriptional regulator
MTTTETATDLFNLLGEALQALGAHYGAALQQANADLGLEGHDWGLLFAVNGVDPEPITAMDLQQFAPYVTAHTLESQISGAVGRGFLAGDDTLGYRLTERGHHAVKRSFGSVHQALAELEPLPAADMRRLIDLLQRLVEATIDSLEPADKRYLLSSRRTDPGDLASAAARIDQYLTDLVRYRDDAHQAAWRPYAIGGSVWEVLTMIWRGEADTVATVAERLERRAQSPETYAQALQELVARGWIAELAGAYRMTELGGALRQATEATTDRYFYTPWSSLNEAEIDELRGLLTRLRDRLNEMREKNTG